MWAEIPSVSPDLGRASRLWLTGWRVAAGRSWMSFAPGGGAKLSPSGAKFAKLGLVQDQRSPSKRPGSFELPKNEAYMLKSGRAQARRAPKARPFVGNHAGFALAS
jgi:hypothetical protein